MILSPPSPVIPQDALTLVCSSFISDIVDQLAALVKNLGVLLDSPLILSNLSTLPCSILSPESFRGSRISSPLATLVLGILTSYWGACSSHLKGLPASVY